MGAATGERPGHLLYGRSRSSPSGPEEPPRSTAGPAGGPGSTIAARARPDQPIVVRPAPTPSDRTYASNVLTVLESLGAHRPALGSDSRTGARECRPSTSPGVVLHDSLRCRFSRIATLQSERPIPLPTGGSDSVTEPVDDARVVTAIQAPSGERRVGSSTHWRAPRWRRRA